MTESHVGTRYDRLPAHDADRDLDGRPTRAEVLEYFAERFGIEPRAFDPYSLWEKGKGKIWAFRGTHSSPLAVEAMGIHLLRTRQRFWKPTTDAMQLFGRQATRNVLACSREQARAFWRGETQPIEWAGEQGYVIVTHPLGGEPEPLGVGLVVDDELRSVVPKARRRDLADHN